MNIIAGNSAVTTGGGTVPAQHNPGRQRDPAGAAAAQEPAAREAIARPMADARPVLDLSEPALTRRDLPRGSLVDIVC